MDPWFGDGCLAIILPRTSEPLANFHVGPLECVPICRPCASKRVASGDPPTSLGGLA